ncbi:MAG: dicarboxylate/amino acid:cation symporter [Chlamydiia bacterium]|nr:dicarboxylate/amino acid:cation symporter [Chlamydiia bacterium]
MKLWIKILIGLGLGFITGLGMYLFDHYDISKLEGVKDVLNTVGQAFINLLKMLVGIMLFSSLVSGICHLHDPKKLSRIGLRTIGFYIITTLIAIGIGVVLAMIFRPGRGLNYAIPADFIGKAQKVEILDFLLYLIPSNPFAAFAEGNILQVIVFAIFFAVAVTLSGEKGKPVLHFIESVLESMYTLTHFIMKFAPYGVFALIAIALGTMGFDAVLPLLKFLMCNYIACLIQIFVIFGLSLRLLAGLEIAPFFKGMKDAIVLAFSTNSSTATLPVTLECTRDHLGVSEDISGFVVSLGSTINMNGAAIGQAISAIFIAEAYNIELSVLKIGILFFVALISAIGAAGIPGTGLIMLSVVLNAMGLPLDPLGAFALIAGVDRLREMVSSVVNVLGDAVAAVVIAQKEKQLDTKKYHHATWLE